MKKRIIALFALLTVVALCFAACNTPSLEDLQNINDLLKVDYSKVTVVVSTKTATAELNGNFTLTFDGDVTKVEYRFERINSFDVDDNGNIADAEGDFIETVEGEVAVRDGKIVDGDTSVDLPLDELTVGGFSFKQAFFSNSTLQKAKFEADVINPQQFTGNSGLDCTDMHVVVIRNTAAKVLTSIELTYTSENGAQVKLDYLFTK